MDIIDINNPLSSSYTDNILMEKIGIRDSSYKESDNMNHIIQMALLQQELEANKRKLNELEKSREKQNHREHFTSGCDCSSTEGMHDKKTKCRHKHDSEEPVDSLGLNNKKILMILVIVLAAFCIIQYFSYKSEMKEMMMMLCSLLKQDGKAVTSNNTVAMTNIPAVLST